MYTYARTRGNAEAKAAHGAITTPHSCAYFMTSRGSGEKSEDQSSLPAPVEKIPRLAREISRSSYSSSCCGLRGPGADGLL
ncbi:hypothetical protein SRHO_G00057450 [Serrasalmus rhombeus]